MNVDETVAQHFEVLREIMATPEMEPTGPLATVSNPRYFRDLGFGPIPTPERRELHTRWLDEAMGEVGATNQDRHAVVMAGPPGAGKGYVQGSQLGGLPGYVVCDPDEFKKRIIEHALDSGTLDEMKSERVKEFEAQGERFAPMEFASLVHEESSYLAARLQDRLMRQGDNVVLDTVLKSEQKAQAVLDGLTKAGYTYEVISVQTTEEISRQSIRERWEEPYRKFLEEADLSVDMKSPEGRIGGRPVPSAFARSVFPQGGGTPTPEPAARWLANASTRCTEYRLFRRQEGQPHKLEEHLKQVEKGGKLVPAKRADRHQAMFPRPHSPGPRRPRDQGQER